MPVYVSLNNLNNLNELRDNILKEIVKSTSNLNTKLIEAFNTVENVTNLSTNILNIIKKLKKNLPDVGLNKKGIQEELLKKFSKSHLLIFFLDNLDNLEKINSNNVDIEELKTFLSNLLEENDNKIIIISNENIVNKFDDLINKELYFDKFNEHNTYNLSLNIIKHNLYYVKNNYKDIYNKIFTISSQLLTLKNININLRTICNIISDFNIVFEELKNHSSSLNVKVKEKILITAFISIFVFNYIKQSKGNKPNNDISNMFNKNPLFIEPSNDEIKFIIDTFHNKYEIFDKNIMYSEEIYNLVFHDVFNFKAFKSNIENIFYKNIYLTKLINYKIYKEKNLRKIENKAEQIYINNNTSFHQLVDLYISFKDLNDKKLLFIKFDEHKLQNIIIKKIDNLTEKELNDPIFQHDISSIINNNLIVNSSFKNKINDKLQKNKEQIIYNKNYKAAQKVIQNKTWDINNLEKRFHDNNIFVILQDSQLFNQLINEPLSYVGINNFLTEYFLDIKFNKYKVIKSANNLIYKLSYQKRIGNIEDKVVKYNLNMLINTIKQINHLILKEK